jgi:bifunctional non-homologous end joining protein LigD
MEGTEDEPPPEPTADDKEERPVEAEKKDLIIGGVKITHPDKVLFDDPRITKEDLIRYYEKVSERMLPYVARRILSIVRCPKAYPRLLLQKAPGTGQQGDCHGFGLSGTGETESISISTAPSA